MDGLEVNIKMTLRIWVDKQINKIRILTNDPSVKFLLEKTQEETKYIPWEKRWGTVKTTFKIYDKVKKDQGMWNFILGLGWAGYIIGMFQKYMSPDDYNGLLKDAIYSDEVRTFPFPGALIIQKSIIECVKNMVVSFFIPRS